jgi:hypothetical protein
LLVEPMKGEGIYELYRQQAKAATQPSKPQTCSNRAPARLDGVVRGADKARLNRSRSLAGRSDRPRQQSSQVTGGPMVRIHLPPALQRRVRRTPTRTGEVPGGSRGCPLLGSRGDREDQAQRPDKTVGTKLGRDKNGG